MVEFPTVSTLLPYAGQFFPLRQAAPPQRGQGANEGLRRAAVDFREGFEFRRAT